MKPIDPIQLDRLIDGELSRDQIRDLMEQTNQDTWREIATAFVEDRVWRTEIQASMDEPKLENAVEEIEATKTRLPKTTIQPKPKPKQNTALRWISLAAGLLIAVTFGYLAGASNIVPRGVNQKNPMATNDPNTSAGSNLEKPASDESDDPVITIAGLTDPDYHVSLQDGHGNPILNSDIPLYSTRDMQAGLPAFDTPPISDEMKKSFHGSGYEFKENTRFLAGQLDDGRQFVVPIRTINLSAGQ